MACGILVPRPGIKPIPPAVEAQSLNHWTAREVPSICHLNSSLPCNPGMVVTQFCLPHSFFFFLTFSVLYFICEDFLYHPFIKFMAYTFPTFSFFIFISLRFLEFIFIYGEVGIY